MNKSHIVFIVDKSGSMGSIKSDAIGGFNSFLKDQKACPGEASLTLVLFDHEYHGRIEYSNIQDAKELTSNTYQPSGMTALLDAMGRTIDSQGELLSKMSESDRPNKVIVVVITDGEENSSKEYTRQRIKEMIKLQQETYNWEFIFLAANQDAFAEAEKFGFQAKNTTNYVNTSFGVKSAYASTSNLVRGMRSGPDASFDTFGRPT